KSETFKNSSMGHATTKVENMSQTSMAVGGGSKLSFKLKYIERQGVITYEGAIKSEIILAVDQSSYRWVLSKAVSPMTTISLTTVAQQGLTNPSTILSLNHTF